MEIIEENGVKYEVSEVKKGSKVIGTIKTPYYSPEELERLHNGYSGQEGEQDETDN